MSTLCAINLSATEAALVTADISPGEPIRILSNRRVNLVDLQLRASPEQQSDSLSDTAAESNSTEVSNQTEAPSNEAGYETVNQTTHGVRLEIDETTEEILGVIESRETVYSFLELPFQDPKKIEQVATFQIQDGLPFDLENFVVDSFVVGEMSGGNFRVVSSLAPKNVIEKSLATCSHIGIDPRFLTTGAAALITLAQLKYPDRKGLYAYVEFTAQRISVAVLLDSIPVHLRDFYPAEGAKIEKGSQNYNSILHHLGCSVSKCEKDSGQSLAEIVVLGASEHRNALSLAIPYRVELFELKDLVVNSAAEELRIEDCSWALGLFAEQLTAKKKRFTRVLPDFRQGPYAYRRTWQAFVAAVKDEILYLGLAVTLGVGFIGAKISHEYQMMGTARRTFQSYPSRASTGRIHSTSSRDLNAYLKNRGAGGAATGTWIA
jgi:hypothetical protein